MPLKRQSKTLSDNGAFVYRIYGINLNTGEEISADFVNEVEYIYDAYKNSARKRANGLQRMIFLDKNKAERKQRGSESVSCEH
ncbi:MAG: hypothetical protein L6V93_05885 [Clostridiales bacterium]|nr:MAG: hypothetical protein L6V93_05885 [Clostridiales bacterium]